MTERRGGISLLTPNKILVLVKDALIEETTYMVASRFYDETDLSTLEVCLYKDYFKAYTDNHEAGSYITVEDYLKAHINVDSDNE